MINGRAKGHAFENSLIKKFQDEFGECANHFETDITLQVFPLKLCPIERSGSLFALTGIAMQNGKFERYATAGNRGPAAEPAAERTLTVSSVFLTIEAEYGEIRDDLSIREFQALTSGGYPARGGNQIRTLACRTLQQVGAIGKTQRIDAQLARDRKRPARIDSQQIVERKTRALTPVLGLRKQGRGTADAQLRGIEFQKRTGTCIHTPLGVVVKCLVGFYDPARGRHRFFGHEDRQERCSHAGRRCRDQISILVSGCRQLTIGG